LSNVCTDDHSVDSVWVERYLKDVVAYLNVGLLFRRILAGLTGPRIEPGGSVIKMTERDVYGRVVVYLNAISRHVIGWSENNHGN